MTANNFIELFQLGLKPIPLTWDPVSKMAISHTIAHSEITQDNYTEQNFETIVKDLTKANGIALKLFPPFGMIDFDLKNTEDKDIFNRWKFAISSQSDELLDKVCFETTRNGGFHVYIKYPRLRSKVSLAREANGEEVIALYTGGTLAYCDPTPGYDMIWNSFEDIQDLTDDEFSIITSTSESFNKFQGSDNFHNSDDSEVVNGRVLVSYPTEYENTCIQFDRNITEEVFETMLNEMTLFEAKDYRYNKKDNFVAYLRDGSKAKFSAKVYWKSKRVLLFTSSLPLYPSYMDRSHKDDHSWVLSPSKLIYYKNDRDWTRTIEEIKLICDSADIELIEQPAVTNQEIIPAERLKFPIDIFPDPIREYIEAQRIQNEYISAYMVGALSVGVGNKSTLIASANYFVKAIVYLAVVASPGAAKSPAQKIAFAALEKEDSGNYKRYKEKLTDYKKELANFKNQKKGDGIDEPERPVLPQLLIKDSTIEMLLKILSVNDTGCTLLADELSGFLKRMGRYGDNDEVQKWLELWSGSSVLMQRIGRDEDKVENPFCSIVGGIQPGVLEALSSKENEHNGFYHRFLFCYPDLAEKLDWQQHEVPGHLSEAFSNFFKELFFRRSVDMVYRLSGEANDMYAQWFNNKNTKYNSANSDHIKGIIAKYQEYCLRFSLIIQAADNTHTGVYENMISLQSMEKAIRLTEYFFGNMNKAIKILVPETPADKLTGIQLTFYKALPPSFSNKTANDIAEKIGMKSSACRVTLHRWASGKEPLLKKSGERQAATYDKLF